MLFLAALSLFARVPSMPSHHLSSLLIPGDTIYLDRKGKEINIRRMKSIIDTGQAITFIVKTTLTSDDPEESSVSGSKGKYNPISRREARKTEALIRQGEFREAHATGNLIKLWPLGIRRTDWGIVMKDNGEGDTSSADNREYGVTTDVEHNRKAYMGPVNDPYLTGTFVIVKTPANGYTDMHSHPSGKHNDHGFAQPPSKEDIDSASTAAYCTVFGMRSRLVYIYDRTGILAVLPIETYINK